MNEEQHEAFIPEPGEVLASKYRVDSILARGGMGVVLRAQHLELGQRVAIKLLLPEVAEDPELSPRFMREARAAVALSGEHAVRVFDVGELPSGVPYLVMEHLQGHDLRRELELRGALLVPEAVDYLLQVCEGLAEAHRLGIVHRDLKPSNLFLTHAPDGSRRVKILDFGISKWARAYAPRDLAETCTDHVLGSPLYMSPEQLREPRRVDERSDVWSLGVVLYELLSNALPFHGDSIVALSAAIAADPPVPLGARRADVPAELAAVIERCLEKDKGARFSGMAELALALRPFASGGSRARVQRILKIARSAPASVRAEPHSTIKVTRPGHAERAPLAGTLKSPTLPPSQRATVADGPVHLAEPVDEPVAATIRCAAPLSALRERVAFAALAMLLAAASAWLGYPDCREPAVAGVAASARALQRIAFRSDAPAVERPAPAVVTAPRPSRSARRAVPFSPAAEPGPRLPERGVNTALLHDVGAALEVDPLGDRK